MTSRYRVEYALKSHRRDEFIEWIKGLTAVPFVLHAGSGNNFLVGDAERFQIEACRKYAEIFRDVEKMVSNQIDAQSHDRAQFGRLKQLVPTVGTFFTELPLERAFFVQDSKRAISKRRMVAPSFNDIRLILNTAQAMAVAQPPDEVRLVTFDGDVTLYEDGHNLEHGDPVIHRLTDLIRQGIYVGIVTAAGYPEKSGKMYYQRLGALFEAIAKDRTIKDEYKSNLLIMGGECNYLFRLNGEGKLEYVEKELWALPQLLEWSDRDAEELLDQAQKLMVKELDTLQLNNISRIYRKDRAVGLIPLEHCVIPRESLEEIVLNCQHTLSSLDVARRVYFCAFNGGADVWVDIGDKRYGVLSLQRFLGNIPSSKTLHVGDQFASIGANDFKARLAACTVWIANPRETVEILDELLLYLDE